MVAPIVPGDTNQWDVMQWVNEQGQYMPTPTHQLMLFYLASNAFYEADNPEGGEVGQVLRSKSYVEAMMEGTGIKARQTIRNVLNGLQDMAYIQREDRRDPGLYGQQPQLIYVLWDLQALQEDIRTGKRTLPPALKVRPTRAPRKPRKLAEVVELPVSINS